MGLDLLIGFGRLGSEGQTRLVRRGLLLDCGRLARDSRQVLGFSRRGRRKLGRTGFDLMLPSVFRLDLRGLT
jgi:hypothetical protein